MKITTTGITLRTRSALLREAVELLSSMRFAISLLTVLCIASVIGTVVRQHEPASNYVNQFGPFWAEVFGTIGLDTVYSAWWFLLILAFLVVSTSLCIARNTPKILADLRTTREHLREQGLQAFHLKAQGHTAETPQQAFDRVAALLARAGWSHKTDTRRDGEALRGVMVAARKGRANRLGYIAAHAAIVMVCVGGLLDGDLIVRLQMALQGKAPFQGGGLVRDVPAANRLGSGTPSFRANLAVPEGSRAGTALITMKDGVLLQELPFDIELKKFIVEYYATGMPKLFASDIVIHDRDTGAATAARVKVNEPAIHRGIAIYQSSFDDGGSALQVTAYPLQGAATPQALRGTVGESQPWTGPGGERFTLEFTGLRAINVENFAGTGSATDVRKVDLVGTLDRHLGSGARPAGPRELRNVGPSFSYKLRDAAGQAREYSNYMAAVELDGQRVFLAGVRDTPAEAFRYLRIPADDEGRLAGWLRLRRALLDAVLRETAATRYVQLAMPDGKPESKNDLLTTARAVLSAFAGADAPPGGPAGIVAVSDLVEKNPKVKPEERERVSELLLRVLNGSLFELLNAARERDGLAPYSGSEAPVEAFMRQAVMSLSDSFFYPAPVLLQLNDFRQVQASVFQVTRAPGRVLVYAGALCLILGVFAMLYVRDRRLWVWIAPHGDGTRLVAALSTTRRTLDADAEFARLSRELLAGPSGAPLPDALP